MVKSKVNDLYDFMIEKIQDKFIVNGQQFEPDIRKIDKENFHIIHKNRSYQVSIVHVDIEQNKIELTINNRTYIVNQQDENDQILEKIGISEKMAHKTDDLKAPMPGLISDIRVKEGQEVKGGDALIVLKAMKMDNVLKSPHDGVIRRILVEKNQKIEKDSVILQF